MERRVVCISHATGAGGEEEQSVHEAFRHMVRVYARTLQGDRRRLLERFRYVHAARKVVGVGSVGTGAWIVLLLGHDNDDPLFLQAKEAQPSVLEPHVGKSQFATHGQRVVEGQRLMQSASDILLGWFNTPGLDGVERDFYVRQLWDAKRSVLLDVLEPSAFAVYARLCGWTLAKAHARWGTRSRLRATSERAASSTKRSLFRRGVCRPERARLPGPQRCRVHSFHHQDEPLHLALPPSTALASPILPLPDRNHDSASLQSAGVSALERAGETGWAVAGIKQNWPPFLT